MNVTLDECNRNFSKVNDGFICARASEQRELGRKLDEVVLMVLDKGLHKDEGLFITICQEKSFLN